MCGLLAACFNGGRGGWFLRVLAYSCRSARPGAHCIPALSSPLLSTRKQSTAPRTRRLSRPSSCSLANTQPVLPCWRACTHTHTHTHTLLLRVNIDCLASHFVVQGSLSSPTSSSIFLSPPWDIWVASQEPLWGPRWPLT